LDTQHVLRLAAAAEDFRGRSRLAEEGDGVPELPLDGRQPLAEVFGDAPHEEIGVRGAGGERPLLAPDQEIRIEYLFHGRAVSIDRLCAFCYSIGSDIEIGFLNESGSPCMCR